MESKSSSAIESTILLIWVESNKISSFMRNSALIIWVFVASLELNEYLYHYF